MLSEDRFRKLPPRERICTNATDGNELGLYDREATAVTPEERIAEALRLAVTGTPCAAGKGWKLISEEGEYSDSEYITVVADSDGAMCIHRETSFDYSVEVTIEDDEGDKHNAYWWEAAPLKKDFHPGECGAKALARAASQIGSKGTEGGKYNMVVDSEVASRMVSPLLRALDGYSLQQNNSFLEGSLGKKVFSEGFTLVDDPFIKGEAGSKLFDSEGVAYVEGPVIEAGVPRKYFINTYMSGKMGLEPTVEDCGRPRILPWPHEGLDRNAIMRMCGDGILVTDFNGGNCNSATGDFSYGIEGFLFRDGAIVRPVSGLVVTGNFIELWNNFIAAGEDGRRCMSKLIPTLAFGNVNFNG